MPPPWEYKPGAQSRKSSPYRQARFFRGVSCMTTEVRQSASVYYLFPQKASLLHQIPKMKNRLRRRTIRDASACWDYKQANITSKSFYLDVRVIHGCGVSVSPREIRLSKYLWGRLKNVMVWKSPYLPAPSCGKCGPATVCCCNDLSGPFSHNFARVKAPFCRISQARIQATDSEPCRTCELPNFAIISFHHYDCVVCQLKPQPAEVQW